MASQETIERPEAFGLEVEEYGVYQLYDIVASQLWPYACYLSDEADGALEPFEQRVAAEAFASEVNVARVVFPIITLGGHSDIVAQGPQALGQSPMYVAVFSDEQYFHCASYFTATFLLLMM